ncbi:PDZ domain-containing protein [Paraglaciecola sp.]|uniref:M61 family metallopeptidase n=1 Tax=Paraglaciecola sp. TaxID=1920173 RepID=UPI0030F3DC63
MPNHHFPIQYDVALSSITEHLYDISLFIESPQPQGQVLSLPAWIPGSYMIRDFAKHLVKLAAFDYAGNSLTVSKSDKQTWLVEPTSGAITIKYQVYAYDLSVRGAYINDQYGFFNGSNLFLQVQEQTNLPCSLCVKDAAQLFSNYRVSTTMRQLPRQADVNANFYHAQNYAELIDHPVLMGDFDCLPFKIADIDCELVLAGGHQSNMQRIVDDLSQVCMEHIKLFGSPAPINRYIFMTLLTDSAYGGLEHRASTALMYARNELPDFNEPVIPSEAYRNFLSLCSHEFFHTWHVKRIRPLELVNGSLAAECYTEQLWIYEGFTSYYDDLLVQRSKVISTENYLSVVAQNLTRLQRNIGRFKQSVTASSFDAWTKFYKQDESAINNIVSYYNKGAIVAMCLDLAIKLASRQQYNLDSVMQFLWLHHGQTATPTPKTIIHDIVRQHLRLDLTDYFDLDLAIYSTEDLPVESLLNQFGIAVHYRTKTDNNDKGGNPATKAIKNDFGAQFKALDTGIELTQISENSAASEAGLMAGDHLIAIGSWQISAQNIYRLIEQLNEKQLIPIYVLRDKRLLQLTFTIRLAPVDTIYLTIENPEQLTKWLSS